MNRLFFIINLGGLIVLAIKSLLTGIFGQAAPFIAALGVCNYIYLLNKINKETKNVKQ